jgi:hypothetical protein
MWKIRTEQKIISKIQTRYHLEDSDEDDRMMIWYVLKKQDEGCEMDSGGLRWGQISIF